MKDSIGMIDAQKVMGNKENRDSKKVQVTGRILVFSIWGQKTEYSWKVDFCGYHLCVSFFCVSGFHKNK